MIKKILAQIILKKQIQKQTGITKQILPGDVSKAESKAEFAIESLKNRGNINVNNLTKGDLEFLAEDIVNPLKNAEKTIVKQSAEILPFRFKRSFAEELADASKKGDFKRMKGIMSVDPKFKEVIESLKRSKAEEKAYQEMVGPKKLIPDRDVIPFQSPEVQKLSPEEKLARTTLTEDQYKDVLKKGKTLDDVIYAQDFYGDTADDVITKITKGEKFPFAGGGVAGMLGERQNYDNGGDVYLPPIKDVEMGLRFKPDNDFPIGYLNEDILKQIIKNPKQGLEDLQLSILKKNYDDKSKLEFMLGKDNAGIRFSKRFAEGGPARQNFKLGRRAFLKMLASTGAGIAGLKTGITGLGGKKVATEVAKDVATTSSGTVPPYFFNLVKKIKNLGDEAAPSQDKAVAYKYKTKDGGEYNLEEDFAGNIEIKKTSGDEYYPEDVYMSYKVDDVPTKKGGSKKVEEYEEFTAKPDMDGKMKDVEGGVPDSVVKEGTMFEDDITDFATKKVRTKKEGGGVAYMLGQ